MFYNTRLNEVRSGIVTVGRINKLKNHKLLIEAFAKIANKINDDLTIYGSGDTASLKIYAELLGVGQRVHFPGQISNVPFSLRNARLFVLSSDIEGMPNALMELWLLVFLAFLRIALVVVHECCFLRVLLLILFL
nr:glycosyltransferase [Bacteroides sp. D20]